MHKSLESGEIWKNPWQNFVPYWEIPKISEVQSCEAPGVSEDSKESLLYFCNYMKQH